MTFEDIEATWDKYKGGRRIIDGPLSPRDAFIAGYAAALEAAAGRDGWQPIETAPRDRWILVWRQDSDVRDAAWVRFGDLKGCWTEGTGGMLLPEPTHWLPLPEPPQPDNLKVSQEKS